LGDSKAIRSENQDGVSHFTPPPVKIMGGERCEKCPSKFFLPDLGPDVHLTGGGGGGALGSLGNYRSGGKKHRNTL